MAQAEGSEADGLLSHGGPLPSGLTWRSPECLPHGRIPGGGPPLHFNKPRDNLVWSDCMGSLIFETSGLESHLGLSKAAQLTKGERQFDGVERLVRPTQHTKAGGEQGRRRCDQGVQAHEPLEVDSDRPGALNLR